ncbi:hypothetical protein NLJ89_g171 [Agrocybe chaxingu]|uniref:Ribosomal RNA-processing protein 8 n=1 Tax=Agrocybe chaxingu TaxID=84603 RepID=A0A9W8TGC3_9AGAR|nr:hypothetical protein NLJ89_g171 [Agrocybe chaxingu]
MSLFQVPGWSMASAPVREEPQHASKKRKRPSADTHRLEAAEVNIDKLISKLAHPQPGENPANSKGKAKAQDPGRNARFRKKQKLVADSADAPEKRPSASSSEGKAPPSSPTKSKRERKKIAKSNPPATEVTSKRARPSSPQQEAASSRLTALQKGMKESLDGARFRLINETLYKSDSRAAHTMMQEDPKVFEEYHMGFRHQVLSWPTNPVEHYISTFSTYPKKTLFVDLGCGDAALARGLLPKGISVISFDLVSDGKFVVEADICDKIPLPGSEPAEAEKSGGEGQIVDVVVCALSLMGVNWVQCIREAWRVLKSGTTMPNGKVSVVSHPLINAELSKLRQSSTTPKDFRQGVDTISLLLGYEATRDLEEESFTGKTPVASFTGSRVKHSVGLTPILRAGLGMSDALLKLFPSAPVYHLGLFREKVTLQPVEYYSKLPPYPTVDQVFVLDPLIATGGTAVAALTMISDWGVPVKNIKLLCVLASEQGLKHVQEEYPELEIWVAGVDKELTAQGIISPGLGDSGDRLFNTIRA